jgi:acyl carrier protein
VRVSERLREVFVHALGLAADADVTGVHFNDTEAWDSLRHMTLVLSMEDEFGIELAADQFIAIDCFDAALAVLRDCGVHDAGSTSDPSVRRT